MSNQSNTYNGAIEKMLASMRQNTEPQEIQFMGKKLLRLPEVFYHKDIQDIQEFISHGPLKIISEELINREPTVAFDVLEIGPGIGRFVICAALSGPNVLVTAVDINPASVENVNRNAVLHGVSDRVSCAVGDVFNATVTVGKKFDVIFWDPPKICNEDPTLGARTNLERSVYDPEHEGMKQFVARAREFLKPNGRLLISWSNFLGDGAALDGLVSKQGWFLKMYAMAHFPLGPRYITFMSYELIDREKMVICVHCGK